MNRYLHEAVLREQKSFYIELLREHGADSQKSVAWFDGGQVLRFNELVKIIPDRNCRYSMLDIGCGLGDFSSYLIKNNFSNIDYAGIDILKEMTLLAKRKYPGIDVMRADFMNEHFRKKYDFMICSGTLNVMSYKSSERLDGFVKSFINKMYMLSNLGCAFNLLSSREKRHFREDEKIYYADQNNIFLHCRELCRNVEIQYKSEIYGFSVFMKKPL